MEAYNKANVKPEFLEKIKGYLNNPSFSLLLPLIGINKAESLKLIDSLEKNMGIDRTSSNPMNETSSVQQGQIDDLEKFKRGLNSFK